MAIPVVTIIGRSGSGKTTLMEKLIPALSRRGYRVATIKHHSHTGFEIDQPGKDSWRHARAGSVHVIVASPDKLASYRSLQGELPLEEIVKEIREADIILVEGYKHAGYPSIDVLRHEKEPHLVDLPPACFAVASAGPLDAPVPRFSLDDIEGLSDLIETRFLNGSRKERTVKSPG